MIRIVSLSLALVLLAGCGSDDAPQAPPADPSSREQAADAETLSVAEPKRNNETKPTPVVAAPPTAIPPLTTESAADGMQRAVIDQAAYAAFCAAAGLPDPPTPAEIDHVGFGLIHSAIQSVTTSDTNSSLGRLAMMYDGNDMPARATACYQLLLKRQPNAARWWHLLGRSQGLQGNVEEAILAFRQASQLDPDNAATLARLGNLLLSADEIDGAENAFRSTNLLSPNDRAALFGLARVSIEREQWDTAHDLLAQVLTATPRFKPALQQMVIVQRSRGDLDDARRWMERANSVADGEGNEPQDPLSQEVMRTSQSAAYYKSLMAALFSARRYAEAYDAALQILERQPNLALYQRNAASLAKLNGNLDAAIQHAQRAVALNPEYTKGHTVLGELLRDAGRMDEAIAETAKAVELDPADPTNYLSHGAVLASAKQYDSALEQLDRGLAGAPNHIIGLCLRVQCLAAMERLDEAKITLDRILELEPANPWALQVKEQLR